MNSSLEHDFIGYEYSPERKSQDDDTPEDQEELDENVGIESLANELAPDLLHCEICGQEFLKKKDLRCHINIHLGQPRVVLRRIPNLKSVKKKQQDEKYWLDPEQKGTLKLTLKKQCSSDSLKLTFKKSSVSEDFKVINSNLDCQSGDYSQQKVAGLRENDNKDDTELEKSVNEPFENVMINQQEDYDNSKFDTETRNPLEDTERTSMDTNEGDSGVGSDMANPSEREYQNLDDLHAGDQYENSERAVTESDDPDDSDALEATCRETIENLKKLGEQSSSRSEISDKVPEDEEGGERSTSAVQSLQSKPEISLVPKSSMMPPEPVRSSSNNAAEMDKEHGQPGTNSTFSWNQITTDENDKRGSENNDGTSGTERTSGDGHTETAGNLLQSFLMEHQRRNQNEAALSNNIQQFETEYVSLERLAETVNTCRVCNDKFKDMNQLDAHRLKMGHYQCNVPECGNLIFNNQMEVSIHKMQIHGAPMSPNINQMSPHMSANSPHMNQNSPYMNQNSPHLSQNSPHMNQNSPHMNTNSPHHMNVDAQGGVHPQVPGSSPHQRNSPSYNAVPNTQQMISPVNFEQLPAPVQQLAQQVQRMPLPQGQMQPSLPPGANTMIPAPNMYIQPPGRPPMYRVSAPQGMYPHMPHMYPQYAPPGYPGSQMGHPPQMHPQMPQQMPRNRYSTIVQSPRAPRIPQQAMPRQRLKRPMQQPVQMPQPNNVAVNKQRRMDVLLPDRNEDPDCHVIAQQKRNDGVPVIQNVQGATTPPNRSDSTIHLTDSITLSVRQPGSAPAPVQNTAGPSGKKPDAKAVANVLAARGITVTPAMQKGKAAEQKQLAQQQQQQQQQQQRPSPAQNIQALNLNSAISIIPASSQRKQQEQQGQFAVPQNKQSKAPSSEVERPPRPPTVDLTQDAPHPPPLVRRGRPPRALLTCQVCDKRFQNQEMLTQHMANHRATSKLLHKCNLCPAQYPTAQALLTHKQTYHKEVDTSLQNNGGIELALPVVDLKSPHVVNRLSNLGIQSFIPLSQLSAQTGGYFGLPIVTIDGARNPNVCNLGALGATSILSLGPLKHLSNR